MEKTIAVLGGDRRMALLARLLAQDGYPVRTWGLGAFGAEDTPLEEAVCAERIVLPVPLSRGKNLNCTASALPLCGLFALLRAEQSIYAGGVKDADRIAAAEHGLTLTDYLAREELAVRNGVPTAEGAIAAAMAATEVTLCGTPCLVVGFGRIGKLLAHRLRGLGAEVTVSARRLDDLAWIDAFGYRGLHTNRLTGKLGDFRVVFNTVPHTVLSGELLRELPQDCVLIDLASQPGFDRAAAEALGLKCISALGLPGKAAPETAARAIWTTLKKIWEEEA
ncbi:dipicolinate synthase [Oscillibacter valericigenes]|nr:dipicolinate synthase [Oscillibacter valericigenes]